MKPMFWSRTILNAIRYTQVSEFIQILILRFQSWSWYFQINSSLIDTRTLKGLTIPWIGSFLMIPFSVSSKPLQIFYLLWNWRYPLSSILWLISAMVKDLQMLNRMIINKQTEGAQIYYSLSIWGFGKRRKCIL